MQRIMVRCICPVLGLHRGDIAAVWPTRRVETLVENGQLEVTSWHEAPSE